MNHIIPSRYKGHILREDVPRLIADWQPSDLMCAALICRLYCWPLWTPISAERGHDFKEHILPIAVKLWDRRNRRLSRERPPGLGRYDLRAAQRLALLTRPDAMPSRSLAARLLTDEFWRSYGWHDEQIGLVGSYLLFRESPCLIIGRTVAYAARKVGVRPPSFCESTRSAPLNPLHVVAINAMDADGAETWHRKLLTLYAQNGSSSANFAGPATEILTLPDELAELETISWQALNVSESPSMFDAVCCESSAPPLGILRGSDAKAPDQMAPSDETPAPPQQLASLPRLELVPSVDSRRSDAAE